MRAQMGELWRRCWRDLAGVGSVFVMAAAYLSPAVKDGGRFGTFDFVIPVTSLGKGAYTGRPFNNVNSDVISQMNAWNVFNWRQIHSGHFPLWNDLSLLGLPHFLNFESAVLSLPEIVSYAVPLNYAFLVAVLMKLLIAGTGAYFLARVLKLSPFGASFAGVAFMLSGGFSNWLSWPLTDVLAWTGWIAGFAILAYRFPARPRYVAGLAVSIAFCLYGGFPEGNVFVAVCLGVMFVVFVLASLVAGYFDRRSKTPLSLGGLVRLVAGTVAGGLLAMPLFWPGLQTLAISHRTTEGGYPGLPVRSLPLLIAQGYYGIPTHDSPFFLKGYNYYESATYVGVVVLVLACVAVVRWWKHPVVISMAATCVVVLVCVYQTKTFHPVQDFLNHVADQVEWLRFRSVIGLPLGILGGLGLETLARKWRSWWALGAFGGASLVLATAVAVLNTRHVAGKMASAVRAGSLIWPDALVIVCLVVTALWLAAMVTRRRVPSAVPVVVASSLWVASASFLLFAGVGINSYSHSLFPATPAIDQLRHDVGTKLVGLDTGISTDPQAFSPIGFYPEVNIGYGVAEFAGHDPILPEEYLDVFGPSVAKGGPAFVEPDIDSLSLAKLYGVSYVLELPGLAPISGARYVADIAGERLYAIPGAARFTLSNGGKVSAVRHPSSSEYDLDTTSRSAATLLIRVTDEPGWHVTIDGHKAALVSAHKLMWSVNVPAGRHVIRLWYLPDRFVEGLAGAGVAFGALVGWGGLAWDRRRRRREDGDAEPACLADSFSLGRLLADEPG